MLDVASWHVNQVVLFGAEETYNKLWFNTLTDRFIIEKLLDRMRGGQHIDFEGVTREASVAAKADIETNLKDNTLWYEWGSFKRTAAGVGHFLWAWIGYGLFYGLAGFLGSMGR